MPTAVVHLNRYVLPATLHALEAWFLPVLEAAATSSLEELTIHCNLTPTRHDDFAWRQVDDMLSRLPVFTTFNIVIHVVNLQHALLVDANGRDAVHRNLRESMPHLVQAGMLRILNAEK